MVARKVGGSKRSGGYRKYFDHRLHGLGDYTDFLIALNVALMLGIWLEIIVHHYDLVRHVAVFELLRLRHLVSLVGRTAELLIRVIPVCARRFGQALIRLISDP